MKKVFFLSLCIAACLRTASMSAEIVSETDSLRIEQLQEVVIDGVRAHGNEPFAVTDIDRSTLDEYSKGGRELPFLFSRTPGVIAWSDNGTGIGTTYMRIRGAADSRINVTLDGVPLNSPEDQCVFWANMNSYASILGSAQIQRGLGTSTVGDGAFGGSVALTSKLPNPEKRAEITASYGSFNTLRLGGSFSTGTILNSLIIDAAYHMTQTDGFIHGTKGKAGSYYAGLLWTPGDNLMIRYRNIGNFENTGQAWNGVTAGTDDLSIMDGIYGERTLVKTYEDMWNAGLGKFNSLYESLTITPLEQKTMGNPYSYATARYRMKDGSFWDRTTDNFWQDHNILTLAWNVKEAFTTSLTAHYTYGYGYYEEFRPNNKLKKFGLSNYNAPSGTVKKSDFVRKKGLEQHTYGAIWNMAYSIGRLDLRSGVSFQQFKGNHFGYLTYVGNDALSDYLLANGDYKYYDSDATKNDASTYVKAGYEIMDGLHAFADIQFRHVGYRTDGINDKFIDNSDGTYTNQKLDINKKYNFLNAKAGLTYALANSKFHALVATAAREPERNNFTDNGNYPAPEPERMIDYEAGYTYNGNIWTAGLNFYYMDYKDQFVQTGLKSDIGENLTTNIKSSYRTGIELNASVSPLPWLEFSGNAALSQNKIHDFDEVVEDWDDGEQTIHYDNSTLAFSPNAILNGFIDLKFGKFKATWHTGYVSRQYLDNTENADRSLPAYSLSDLSFSYTLPMKIICNSIVFGTDFNNILNSRCATAGWVYSAIYESGGHSNDNRYYQIGFIPAAPFSALAHITLKF
ncbi:MAG: TonB-dependent receptor [Bacteroidaceae bacterium]|nr:TonB-dependent receptor [Bacteroidaceae bacterium]